MRLPERFLLEMQALWAEYAPPGTLAEFLTAHDAPSAAGLRANTLKISPQALHQRHPDWQLAPVPWAVSGFYYPADLSPGRQADYHAGLYYIQEPSAMLPAEVLAPQPGDHVLDLCAAPGGKSTRLAESVGPTGLLWANEINSERAKALLRNVELMGIDRAVISNETPERLAASLPAFFDRILVDAPCSGSGMFRRDPAATASWEKYGPGTCEPIQRDILEAADVLLKPGGTLVYSTCSFSIGEDEQMIAGFLARHPDYHLIPYERPASVSPGLKLSDDLVASGRIWPHHASGDGHFCALLHKSGDFPVGKAPSTDAPAQKLPLDKRLILYQAWLDEVLSPAGLEKIAAREAAAYYRIHQDHLHLVPDCLSDLPGIRYVKTGLYLGEFRTSQMGRERLAASRPSRSRAEQGKKTSLESWRFEPGHALILTLAADDFRYALRLTADDPTLLKYLRGETIEWPADRWPAAGWPDRAWVAVCLNDYPLGWARAGSPGQLKNLYPAGWRRLN